MGKKNKKKNKYEGDNLFLTVIVGVVDNRDAVHSYAYVIDLDEELAHEDLWPNIRHKKWRWTADSGVELSTNMIKEEDKLDVGDFDNILNDIRKKYKIRVSDNGIHEDCCY